MDNKTLISTLEKCVNNLLLHDFPLNIDCLDTQIHLTHKTSYYGICQHKIINGVMYHKIGLNIKFVANGTDKAITNTIYHELLHTLPGCQNHGYLWKQYAKKVHKLFGYNVCRVGGDKTLTDYESMK